MTTTTLPADRGSPPHDEPRSGTGRPAIDVRRANAERLGTELADDLGDPEAFTARLRAGFDALANPADVTATQRVAPGIGQIAGVPWPVLAAVERGLRRATRHDRPGATTLFVADRLLRDPVLESRWFALRLLDQIVVVDPERTWQLLRRAARDAHDWITVDAIAHPAGRGILAEPYRWAELDQLVYAPSPWERRLVGSTIGTIPFIDRRAGRTPAVVAHGLGLVSELIGDADPLVASALAWALRSLARIDTAAVARAIADEAEHAAATMDGHRAWVVRDAVRVLDAAQADAIRARLTGIRRRADAPSSSRAAAVAGRFADLPLGRPPAEPPLR